MSTINYSEKIPNNVNLAEDRTLQRALEGWQPNFIQWWDDVGPEGSTNHEGYLRTAVSVDPQGWAQSAPGGAAARPTRARCRPASR